MFKWFCGRDDFGAAQYCAHAVASRKKAGAGALHWRTGGPSGRKIFSLYENDVHVIVRGEAGAAVEFGNSLFVAETREGFILDHQLLKNQSGGDAKWLRGRLKELKELSGECIMEAIAEQCFESAGMNMICLLQG